MEQEEPVPKVKSEERKSTKNIMTFILLAGSIIFFFISWSQKFTETPAGTYTLVGAFGFTIIFILFIYKKGDISLTKEAMDPKYYWVKFKQYFEGLDTPYLNVKLTWRTEFLYYPMNNPQAIFFSCYDQLHQKPYVAFVKLLDGKEFQIRGLLNYTWKSFLHHEIYKLVMQGVLSSKDGNVTFIGSDGQPLTVPAEALPLLKDKIGL